MKMRGAIFSLFVFLVWYGCSPPTGKENQEKVATEQVSAEKSVSMDSGAVAERKVDEMPGERDALGEPVSEAGGSDEALGDAGEPQENTPKEAAMPEASKESSLLPMEQRTGLIKLKDPLDEPDFYCLDVPGFRSTLKLDSPLMVHTCKKRNAEDETFVMDEPKPGKIFLKAYNRCVEAGRASGRTKAYTRACKDIPLQQFVLSTSGQIQLKNSNPPRCLVVAGGTGTVAGGVSNLRRDLWLDLCSNAPDKLKEWIVPGGKLGP